MKKLLLLTISLIVFSGCSLTEQLNTSGTQSLITSFYPLEFLAKEIGGNLVKVTNLTPAGSEPHDYEPTPRDRERIEKADIILFLGLGMDEWLKKIAESSQKISKEISENLTLLPAAENDTPDEENEAHEESIYDPHVWLDPLQYIIMAENTKEALIAIDPENASSFEANNEALIKELQNLHEGYKTGLSACKKQDIIVSHNAFSYLAERYGFHIHSIAGISPNSEPSPQHLAALADEIKEKNIGYVFFETKVSPTLANTLATETGAQTLVLDPIESLSPENPEEDYISIMQKNLENLKMALECQ